MSHRLRRAGVLGVVLRVGESSFGLLVALVAFFVPDSQAISFVGIAGGLALTAHSEYRAFTASRRRREAELRAFFDENFWPLKRVSDSHPYDLGVAHSPTADRYLRTDEKWPPYVPRDVDGALELALERSGRAGTMTLVVGPSRAGKSRTAFEAVARLFPDRVILVPSRTRSQSLQALRDIDPPLEIDPEGAVLWLDDVEDFVRSGDLTPGTLQALRERYPGLIPIGTIRLTERAELYDSRHVERRIRGLFDGDMVDEVFLDRQLSDGERVMAADRYGELATAGGSISLGEWLAAGLELRARYESSRESQPFGRAVVDAAISWRAAGMFRPIADADLRDLTGHFAAPSEAQLPLTPEAFAEAVEWAVAPVAGTSSLLDVEERNEVRMFQVPGYVEELVATEERPVPEVTWRLVFRRATEEDHLGIALAAGRADNPDALLQLTHAIADSQSVAATWAALYVNVRRARSGQVDAARSGYESVLRSPHRQVHGQALMHLGHLLVAAGDAAGAASAWAAAEQSGDASAAAEAGYSLGVLLIESGEVGGAKAAWRRAVRHLGQDGASQAALRLGKLLVSEGDPEGAVEVLSPASRHDQRGEILALRAAAMLAFRSWHHALNDAHAAVTRTATGRVRDPASDAFAGATRVATMARCAGAIALLKLGRAVEAARWADHAIHLSPRDPQAWASRSRIAVAARNLERATQSARRCWDLDGGGALGSLALGEVALARNDVATAEALAVAAVEVSPEDASGWVLLGRALRRSGRDHDAFVAFSEALQRDPAGLHAFDDEVPLDWAFGYAVRSGRRERVSQLVAMAGSLPLLACVAVLVAIAGYWIFEAATAVPALTAVVAGLVAALWAMIRGRPSRRTPAEPTARSADASPSDTATAAEQLLHDIRLVRRAEWPLSLVPMVLLWLLGLSWVIQAVVKGEWVEFLGAAAVAFAISGVAVIPRRLAQRRVMAMPPNRRLAVVTAGRSFSASSAGPLLGSAALAYAGLNFFLVRNEGPTADAWFGEVLSGGSFVVAGFMMVRWFWGRRSALASAPQSAEEALVQRARSRALPIVAAICGAAFLLSLVTVAFERDGAAPLALGLLYLTVGVAAFARWRGARRAVLRLPDGYLLLRRPNTRSDPAALIGDELSGAT